MLTPKHDTMSTKSGYYLQAFHKYHYEPERWRHAHYSCVQGTNLGTVLKFIPKDATKVSDNEYVTADSRYRYLIHHTEAA